MQTGKLVVYHVVVGVASTSALICFLRLLGGLLALGIQLLVLGFDLGLASFRLAAAAGTG